MNRKTSDDGSYFNDYEAPVEAVQPAQQLDPALLAALNGFMDKPIRTELTRRDHFAIAAMAGLLRDKEWRSFAKPEAVAEKAYRLADAMEGARGA